MTSLNEWFVPWVISDKSFFMLAGPICYCDQLQMMNLKNKALALFCICLQYQISKRITGHVHGLEILLKQRFRSSLVTNKWSTNRHLKSRVSLVIAWENAATSSVQCGDERRLKLMAYKKCYSWLHVRSVWFLHAYAFNITNRSMSWYFSINTRLGYPTYLRLS